MLNTKLLYYATADEVQLGDHICIKRWFHRDRHAVVCYLPGVSEPHPELEYGDVRLWAYRTAEGGVESLPYLPAQKPYAPKGFVLVQRGVPTSLSPHDPLHPVGPGQRPPRRVGLAPYPPALSRRAS